MEHIDETGVPNGWESGSYGSSQENGYKNTYPVVNNTNISSYGTETLSNGKNTFTINDAANAIQACMARNRDENNDGKISGSEVKWFLPAINQLVGMFLGAESLPTPLFGAVSYTHLEKFQVEAGNNVKVYAFINPIMEIPTTGLENLKVGKQKLPSEGLDYIAETIAKSGNFMMSNVNGEPTVIKAIVGGTDTNTANISVERISAKLTEETKRSIDNKYELTTPTFVGPKVYVQILSHTYTNLADDSYVLGGRNAAWSSFLHPYKTGEVSEKMCIRDSFFPWFKMCIHRK